jgi:hypothetical protein
MRRLISYSVAAVLLSSVPLAAAETPVAPEPTVAPTLTAEQPVNPAASAPGGPVLQSISVRLVPQAFNLPSETIIPEFHFIAPNGNAVLLHRELVATNANNFHLNPATAINVPADAQKKGAVIPGGWTCKAGPYYATVRAYILADDGSRSNSVQYTVHCNGG